MQGNKEKKQRTTIASFVAASGKKEKPVVIWRGGCEGGDCQMADPYIPSSRLGKTCNYPQSQMPPLG